MPSSLKTRERLERKTGLRSRSEMKRGKLSQVSKRKPTRPLTDGVKVYPDAREVCDVRTAAGAHEYERRTVEMAKRQNYLCAAPDCGGPLRGDITFDHEAGRTAGRKDERILHADGVTWRNAAIHSACNRRLGSVRHHWLPGNTAYVPLTREERLAA